MNAEQILNVFPPTIKSTATRGCPNQIPGESSYLYSCKFPLLAPKALSSQPSSERHIMQVISMVLLSPL